MYVFHYLKLRYAKNHHLLFHNKNDNYNSTWYIVFIGGCGAISEFCSTFVFFESLMYSPLQVLLMLNLPNFTLLLTCVFEGVTDAVIINLVNFAVIKSDASTALSTEIIPPPPTTKIEGGGILNSSL